MRPRTAIMLSSALVPVWLGATFELLPAYTYQCSAGEHRYVECVGKGCDLETVRAMHDVDHGPGSHRGLLRVSRPRWWSPWDWHDLATHERWRLPESQG